MRLIHIQQPKLHTTSWLGTFLVGEEYKASVGFILLLVFFNQSVTILKQFIGHPT